MEQHLITGPADLIGSCLVEHPLTRGNRVIAIDNFNLLFSPEEKRRNLASILENSDFELIELDCADVKGMEETIRDLITKTIVILAAKAGVRPSIASSGRRCTCKSESEHVTKSVLKLAQRREIKRFAFSSIYGNDEIIRFAESSATQLSIRSRPTRWLKRSRVLLCHS